MIGVNASGIGFLASKCCWLWPQTNHLWVPISWC